jgi:hypothetical protein
MSPRPKSAAGGPSVLSEDIISETVEEIAELCRCLTKRVRTGRHDSEFGALEVDPDRATAGAAL